MGNIEQEYGAWNTLLNDMTSIIKKYHWNKTKVKVRDYVSMEQPDH